MTMFKMGHILRIGLEVYYFYWAFRPPKGFGPFHITCSRCSSDEPSSAGRQSTKGKYGCRASMPQTGLMKPAKLATPELS